MYIRKLTDEDKTLIRKAKQKANDEIKKERKVLLAHIRKLERKAGYFSRAELRILDNRLETLKPVTGSPVIAIVGDNSICLKYNTLEKLSRSLRRSGYRGIASIINTDNRKTLHVKYDKGEFELFELPLYQVNLLHGLPIIEIA